MNEFNVLLNAATNGTPSGSLFDALFARYIAPQESWRELESPLPITILAAGEDLIDYRIYGNTENGESVGERTENLFDSNMIFENGYINANGVITIANSMVHTSDYIPIKNSSQYVLTGKLVPLALTASVAMYDAQKNYISRILGGIGINTFAFTTTANCSYVRFSVNDGFEGFQYDPKTITLTEGSTAPTEYIPYGYKLPMTTSSELKDVGDQVLVDGEPWDIVDYNNERTIATLCKKTLSIAVPFSSKEALFAFPNGLAAGTYHFTMPKTPWYLLQQDSEKNIEFTLTNDIPPNGQLVVTPTTPTSRTLIGGTISCYTSPTSTVATETATLSEGTGGTELESPSFEDDPTGNANSILHGVNGTTTYKNSPLRQLLNSSASAGNVWTPANKFDRPPTWASSIDGFMHDMDTNFINAMGSINFVTASNQNASYQLDDKIFLPSYTEISGIANYNVYEGNQYQFYVDADANKRKKYTSDNISRTWWLRSIGPYSIANTRFVTQNGNYDYGSPTGSYYISPACHIDLTQSDNPWIKSNMYKSTTTTPIYIGSDPLAEDEYVDFGGQKIYRMESGTLTPTEPPVPIPALPTIEGETIIDYNPSTTPAVEPEKMYIKYKPQ